jgi:hypothetical protein
MAQPLDACFEKADDLSRGVPLKIFSTVSGRGLTLALRRPYSRGREFAEVAASAGE